MEYHVVEMKLAGRSVWLVVETNYNAGMNRAAQPDRYNVESYWPSEAEATVRANYVYATQPR